MTPEMRISAGLVALRSTDPMAAAQLVQAISAQRKIDIEGAEETATAAERVAVAAWLRAHAHVAKGEVKHAFIVLAQSIENGEHRA